MYIYIGVKRGGAYRARYGCSTTVTGLKRGRSISLAVCVCVRARACVYASQQAQTSTLHTHAHTHTHTRTHTHTHTHTHTPCNVDLQTGICVWVSKGTQCQGQQAWHCP